MRATLLNNRRAGHDLPKIDFSVALRVGDVIYGNVGLPKRPDFTATGPAVGLVSPCEALTRALESPLIATRAFADHYPEEGHALGHHDIRGIADGADLVSYAPKTT